MSKPSRPLRSPVANPPNAIRTFLVTSVTWERRQLFRSERMANLLLDVLFSYRHQAAFYLHEFVLMPDHFHLLMSVPADRTLEKAVQLVKGGFSYRARKELGFCSEIWQRSFSDQFIYDLDGYENCREYIRANPVRARLVTEAETYRYSSAHPGFVLDPVPDHLKG